MALATNRREGGSGPWMNHTFFAFDEHFELYFISAPDAVHSANLDADPNAAAAIFDGGAMDPGQKRGAQLFGHAKGLGEQEVMAGVAVYAERFPKVGESVASGADLRASHSWIYRFSIAELKLFDEPRFGNHLRIAATRIADPGLR